MEGREEVVIVDSVKTGKEAVGAILSMTPDEFNRYAPITPHYLGAPEAISIMKELDLNPPKHIHILGIEVEDPYTVSDKISKKLEERLDEIAEKLYKMIRELTSC